jgi:hypothetical protein
MTEPIPYVDRLERITDQEVSYANHNMLYPIIYPGWFVIEFFSGDFNISIFFRITYLNYYKVIKLAFLPMLPNDLKK